MPPSEGYVFRALNDIDTFREKFENEMKEENTITDHAFLSTSRFIDGVVNSGTDSAILIIRSRNDKSNK